MKRRKFHDKHIDRMENYTAKTDHIGRRENT